MTSEIIIAGFGGQGILFLGKILSYAALIDEKEVSWLPSYGPEMRGGTCNCSVCASDAPIGSPLVVNPTALIAMNAPSLEKFIDSVRPGGVVLVDSSIVDIPVSRTDVTAVLIPATEIATDNSLAGGANMVMLGKLIKETGIFEFETVEKAIRKSVPANKSALIENNLKAIRLGME